jgi:hypothetical protein
MADKKISQRVEFKTVDGVILRGDYYAVDSKKAPIVVMTQGVGRNRAFMLSPNAKSN